MKTFLKILVLIVLTFAGIGGAFAHGHGGVVVGVGVGVPIWSPWYYPPPAYYPYPVVERVAPPAVYVEQAAPAPADNSWYYCRSAKAYYPYVKDCPSGWERVSPQPNPR